MANISCNSCEDLRQAAPNFVINGLGTTECTSLKNNTGLDPSKGHTNCEDLDDMNDCLVGNMVKEVDSYQNCDWKKFAKKFIGNVWTVLKGIICTICGIWTKLQCIYRLVVGDNSITLHDPTPGTGVEIRTTSSSTATADVDVIIGAGCYRVQGSIKIYLDGTSGGLNMDDYWGSLGVDKRVKPRNADGYFAPRGTPNSSGYNSGHRDSFFITNVGNWTLVTFLIKKSDVPWVRHFYYGVGGFQDIGAGDVTAQWADGDSDTMNTLTGQWGKDDTSTAVRVPAGYYGVKVGLSSLLSWDGFTTEDSTGRHIVNCTFNVMGMYKGNGNSFAC